MSELNEIIKQVKANPDEIEELVIYYLIIASIGDLDRIQDENGPIRKAFKEIKGIDSKSYLNLMDATYFYFTSAGRKAEKIFLELLPPNYEWKNKSIAGAIHVILGGVYRSLGEFDRCIFHQQIAQKTIGIGDKLINYLVFSFYNLSEVYQLINEPLAAEECLLEGLEKITDERKKFRLYSSLGNLNLSKQAYKEAEEFFQASMKVAEGKSQISRVNYDLAVLEQKQGNHKKAIELASKSYDIRIEGNLHDAATTCQILIGESLLALNQITKALEILDKAKVGAIEHQAKAKLKEIHFLQARAYESTESWKQAFAAFKAYEELESGLFADQQKEIFKLKNAEIQKQKAIIETVHKELTDSINYAERIQKSFLPSDALLETELKEHFIYFKPKEVVSGDFYWAGLLSNGNFAVLNADSTGHGVPGSIMSILNVNSIEKAIEKRLYKPADIFNDARKTIIERLKNDGSKDGGKDGMDASLISLNKERTQMDYVAANNPIWIIREGELIEIKAEKMPVGKHDNDHIPFKGGSIQLKNGDQIYTLTDGYQDQFGGEKGKKYKVRPLKNMLLQCSELPMKEQRMHLEQTFESWKGTMEQVDDICLIGIRITN